MKKIFLLPFFFYIVFANAQPNTSHNLVFDSLAKHWDEAMPLGNGMLGALVWQQECKLRISLDRVDLWDERTAVDLSKFDYKFVQQQVAKNDYDTVHKLGDWPYYNIAYPTKLPFPQSLPTGTLRFAAINIIFITNLRFNLRFNKSRLPPQLHKSPPQAEEKLNRITISPAHDIPKTHYFRCSYFITGER